MTRETARQLTLALLALAGVLCCRTQHTDLVSDELITAADSGKPRDAAASSTRSDAATSGAKPDAATMTPLDAGMHIASARCGKAACACDDGMDNDNDGISDGLDPECTGSFDDDEASFGIGKPNKQAACRDCFWDDNAGSGDDGCRYPAECLRGTTPNGNGNCSSCEVSAKCLDNCRARTPNGCDCFGCCQVAHNGASVFVELDDSCTLARLDDSAACPRCVQNTACANPCGRCELCLGRRVSDLPADCQRGSGTTGPQYVCDEGQQTCESSLNCAGALYCHLGCCLVELL